MKSNDPSDKTGELTVVIPAFNAESTLARAISSAFDSGATRVLVVDDGSVDATETVARACGADYLAQVNQGASVARLSGGDLVDTEFMTFLDADDVLIPQGVQRSLEVLSERPELAVAAGTIVGVGPDGRGRAFPVRYSPVTTHTLLQKGFGPWPPAAEVIRTSSYRESLALSLPAMHPRFADDYELLIRLSLVGKIDVRTDPVCYYSMMGGKSERNAAEAIKTKEGLRKYYADHIGLPISMMSEADVVAAAYARVARGQFSARKYASAAASTLKWFFANPAGLWDKLQTRLGLAAPHSVFVWATGQDENLGDSLLRRGYLDALRVNGPLSVWTGAASDRFLTGLGLQESDETQSDYRAWAAKAWGATMRGPIVLALNAGEVPVSKRGALRLTSLIPLILLVRLRKGMVVWSGAGTPVQQHQLTWVYRITARLASIATWRDGETHSLLGVGSVAPDWAFALGDVDRSPGAERDQLAVVLRGDRSQPSATWIAWLSEQARIHGLRMVFVVQVERDQSLAERLSAETGGRIVGWSSTDDHSSQESRVREVYGKSLIAVGDRLHGLVVAATEGAVPVGWVASSTGKIGRHFDAVGMDWVGELEGRDPDLLPNISEDTVKEWAALTSSRVIAAKRDLACLEKSLEIKASPLAVSAHG